MITPVYDADTNQNRILIVNLDLMPVSIARKINPVIDADNRISLRRLK